MKALTLVSLLACVSAASVIPVSVLESEIHSLRAVLPSYPFYLPTTIVRLMVVALDDTGPFLTGAITTKGDRLVVANIPNGDPPAAFNVTAEHGFRAQNGKYIYFDYANRQVRLDDNPHNETQYMEDGSISTLGYSADGNIDVYVLMCPGAGNVFTLSYSGDCDFGANVAIFPIPPQGLTELWSNSTLYPSPQNRGWLNWDAVNTTVGDNSTYDPNQLASALYGQEAPKGGARRMEVGWWAALSLVALVL